MVPKIFYEDTGQNGGNQALPNLVSNDPPMLGVDGRNTSLALDDNGALHILHPAIAEDDTTNTIFAVYHTIVEGDEIRSEPVSAIGEKVKFSQFHYSYFHNNGGNLDWVWLKQDSLNAPYSLQYHSDPRHQYLVAISNAALPIFLFDPGHDEGFFDNMWEFAEEHGLEAIGNAFVVNGLIDRGFIEGGGIPLNVGFQDQNRGNFPFSAASDGRLEDMVVPKGAVLYRMVSPDNWVPVENQQADENGITAMLMTYSIYQFFVPIADYPFILGEVYSYPNPVRKNQTAILHVEVGMADAVRTRVYDAAGDLVWESRIDNSVVMVNGKPAYEMPMDMSRLTSGVYRGYVTAEKNGEETLRKSYTFSVIR